MTPDWDSHPAGEIRCPRCGCELRELIYATGDFTVVYCAVCPTTFRLAAVDARVVRATGGAPRGARRANNVVRFPVAAIRRQR